MHLSVCAHVCFIYLGGDQMSSLKAINSNVFFTEVWVRAGLLSEWMVPTRIVKPPCTFVCVRVLVCLSVCERVFQRVVCFIYLCGHQMS